MKRSVLLLALGASLGTLVADPLKRDFEADAIGSPAAGFEFARTGGGAEGRWVVRAEKGGTTPDPTLED
jgi:hypothetical protein